MTLAEAKLVLKIDDDFDDSRIQSLIDAIPNYIYDCTGLTPENQATEPLVKVVSEFLIVHWYEHGAQYNVYDKTITSLLKTLKVKTQAEESRQAAASE